MSHGTASGQPEPRPSLFDSIRAHSNCVCSFCWAMWELIETETITDLQWECYAGHLTKCHGWVPDEIGEA